jgi:hypothetical protein
VIIGEDTLMDMSQVDRRQPLYLNKTKQQNKTHTIKRISQTLFTFENKNEDTV